MISLVNHSSCCGGFYCDHTITALKSTHICTFVQGILTICELCSILVLLSFTAISITSVTVNSLRSNTSLLVLIFVFKVFYVGCFQARLDFTRPLYSWKLYIYIDISPCPLLYLFAIIAAPYLSLFKRCIFSGNISLSNHCVNSMPVAAWRLVLFAIINLMCWPRVVRFLLSGWNQVLLSSGHSPNTVCLLSYYSITCWKNHLQDPLLFKGNVHQKTTGPVPRIIKTQSKI